MFDELTLSREQTVKLIFSLWVSTYTDSTKLKPTVQLLGPPGTGKSAIQDEVASLMEAHVQSLNPMAPGAVTELVDSTSKAPEDIGGLPDIREGHTHYAGQSWLARCCAPGAYGVLMFDDLPAASQMVAKTVRQLAHPSQRSVNDMRLSDGMLVLVTGNRKEDKAGASAMPSHHANAVVTITLRPTLDEWLKWYGQEGNMASMIPSFLVKNRGKFQQHPRDACPKTGAFATPRSWAMVGAGWDAVSELGDADILLAFTAGCVGIGIGSELVAWSNLRRGLVDPALVVADPKKHLPSSLRKELMSKPDTAHALFHGLGEYGAELDRTAKHKGKAAKQFAQALFWASDGGGREYLYSAFQVFVANGGNTRRLIAEIQKAQKAGESWTEGMREFFKALAARR